MTTREVPMLLDHGDQPQPYIYHKPPTLNLAIGPSCPVRCEGCYQHFGMRDGTEQLVTGDDVLNFAAAAAVRGIEQATLSGGDPLAHPDIIGVLAGLKSLDMYVQLDTVGTMLLGETPIIYKGLRKHQLTPKIDVEDIAPFVDMVSIPLDGASDASVANFRKGRPNLLEETLDIGDLLFNAGVPLGVNTVVHSLNIQELGAIREYVEYMRASEWQIFQYDPSGPNPSKKQAILAVSFEDFQEAVEPIELEILCDGWQVISPIVTSKSLAKRRGAYVMIDPMGIAREEVVNMSDDTDITRRVGHIIKDQDLVLEAILRANRR